MSKIKYEFGEFQKTVRSPKKKSKSQQMSEDGQDKRHQRINFKNYIRKIKEQELNKDQDDEDTDFAY
jgi:cytochrome c2